MFIFHLYSSSSSFFFLLLLCFLISLQVTDGTFSSSSSYSSAAAVAVESRVGRTDSLRSDGSHVSSLGGDGDLFADLDKKKKSKPSARKAANLSGNAADSDASSSISTLPALLLCPTIFSFLVICFTVFLSSFHSSKPSTCSAIS